MKASQEQQQTKNKDRGKEHKHKNKNKSKHDPTWGTLNTVPETQFQETCDPESITLPMSFGLIWTPKGSAVHCELPYFKIVLKQNPPWWTKVKAPPWPLAQQPRTMPLSKWSGNQTWEAKYSTSSCKAVATSKAMQKIHKHVGPGKRICCEWEDRGKNLMCGGILCEAVVPRGDFEGWLCSKTKRKNRWFFFEVEEEFLIFLKITIVTDCRASLLHIIFFHT